MGRRRKVRTGDKVLFAGELYEVTNIGQEHLQIHAPERGLGCVWVLGSDCRRADDAGAQDTEDGEDADEPDSDAAE